MNIENELKSDFLLTHKSFAAKSLSWLNKHLDSFSPTRNNNLCLDGVKAFSELSLLYTYLKKRNHLEFEAEISNWQSFFENHLKNKLYAEAVRKRPKEAYHMMFPYLQLRSTGYKSGYYEESHQYMINWGHYDSIELVPFRKMDLEYFLWKSDLQGEPDWIKHFPSTILGRFQSTITLDESAAYSITHTLFYMTDFGNRSLSLSQSDIDEIANVLEALLIHYWRVGHYDLMGELLINLTFLEKNNTYLYRNARNAFLNAWNEDGSIPAMKNKRNESEQSEFSFCYHTTLVGVLLCAVEINKTLQKEASK
ncbi:DUF6895 family protein [Alkalicoccus saliphilus]|uniref:DUF6895 domain-containing protein n=1 Tax=Alkalicoccus saliphilus TaxID=200989 RepID=A0A2T4U6R9_9BACI|nr:hypothetical protein [Alkalicoccus saliphilus]PTL39103.1 hypothetical protein C6Y45_07955 [Alkalicoccus saliphilus]